MAFEAAVKGTVFDYQGQYVELTAQVHGVSLVDPMNKEDQVEANNGKFPYLEIEIRFFSLY